MFPPSNGLLRTAAGADLGLVDSSGGASRETGPESARGPPFVLPSPSMNRLPLFISCVALLLSAFALHMADRTRRDVQAFIYTLPAQKDRQ